MILKPCPFCRKDIPRSITVCPYCHRDEQGKTINMDSTRPDQTGPDYALPGDLKALSSEDQFTRDQAVVRVAQRGTNVTQALISILSDFAKPGLAGIALSLGKIGDKRAISVLAQAAKMGDEELRIAAVWALSQFHDDEVLPILLSESERPHPVVQSYLANVLGTFQDPRVRPVLAKLVVHPNREVAFQAACALGELGGKENIPLLKATWRKGDVFVRAASAAALARLGAKPTRFSPWTVAGVIFVLIILGGLLSWWVYK